MKEQLNTLLPMPKKYHPTIANKIKLSDIVASDATCEKRKLEVSGLRLS